MPSFINRTGSKKQPPLEDQGRLLNKDTILRCFGYLGNLDFSPTQAGRNDVFSRQKTLARRLTGGFSDNDCKRDRFVSLVSNFKRMYDLATSAGKIQNVE